MGDYHSDPNSWAIHHGPKTPSEQSNYREGSTPSLYDERNIRNLAEALGVDESTVIIGSMVLGALSFGLGGRGVNNPCPHAGSRTWQQAGMSHGDALRIQNAATSKGVTITVVGSRASGTSNRFSDWDYILGGANSSRRHGVKNSIPRGHSGGEYNSGIDFFQNYTPGIPGYSKLRPDDPHVIFVPQK